MKDRVSGFSCGNVHCCHVCNAIAPHADAALCIRCASEVGARVHYDPDRGWYAGFPADRREGCWHCAGARLSRNTDGVNGGVKFVIAPCRVCGRSLPPSDSTT